MSPSFELWIELEELVDCSTDDSIQNFCNIAVLLPDGRRYAMNVWTFDFLPLARYPWPYEAKENQELAKYIHPPDLFVERLDRSTLEAVIKELLEKNEMNPDWLYPQV
jgi:hypothetical protein